MEEKYNFRISPSDRSVSIRVSPEIFPIPVILHSAYHFIDEAEVIVEPDKLKDKIVITLIFDKETDLENLAYEFNIQLISSFVEGEESKIHAGIRDTMMKAALLPGELKKQPGLQDIPLEPKK